MILDDCWIKGMLYDDELIGINVCLQWINDLKQ